MQETAKYLIHASIETDGVVERSDVVGAIFGQTEGLLGDELDLRDLQQSSKVGRIDVQIDAADGATTGSVTIASALDKVETAILAAALESIDRVGPCRAEVEITGIEDVRTARRREVVERATELLSEFEEEALSSQDLVEEVRQNVRVADITTYEGLPAGPRVADSDAVIVVEGRADVLTLLQYGVKNALAVEGTDVPEAVAQLTQERTVTAFLDGDRGGELILKELVQVGDVDFVAFAPAGRSVEDLSRDEVMAALREKVAYADLPDASAPDEAVAVTDGSTRPAPPAATADPEAAAGSDADDTPGGSTDAVDESPDAADPPASSADVHPDEADTSGAGTDTDAADPDAPDDRPTGEPSAPETLARHVETVVGDGTGRVRLLDGSFGIIEEVPFEDAFEAIRDADPVPTTVVSDGTVGQRVLDVAAQRGVEQIVATGLGQFVKQPTNVRLRTAADL
jgi:DNA primase